MTRQELPYQTDPLPLLAAIRPLGRPVLLHSADRRHPDGRFDILAAGPVACIDTHEPAALQTVEGWLANPPAAVEPDDDLPFCGGVIGLAGYDFGRRLHTLRDRSGPEPFPELTAGHYPWAVVTDHHRARSWLVAEPGAAVPPLEMLRPRCLPRAPDPLPRLACDVTAAEYGRAFARIQEYIRAGDCYQVNLAVRFSGAFDGDPLALYAGLTHHHPAPFSGYLETPAGAILSFSPERFIEARDRILETRPIKGTRPRGADPETDRRLAEALLTSAKDRAENLMIVDLLRNDLGRSCIPGSIEVPRLFDLESFGSVHHLVSRIRGRLAPGVTPLAAFARAFPGGSITGAPKLRAMQIIDELEAHPRGPYCGSLFMADRRGRFDSSITIRTLLHADGALHCWGGGGLVADSTLDDEWDEIHHKVGALIGHTAHPAC